MTDPRTIIERAAERVVPKHDAFERLERARARKTLNRRITAAVVAVLVAIGGSYAAFAAFGSAGGTIAGGSSGFHALWPEQTLDAAQQEQTAVDGGADAWRTDPKQVATRFVTDVLGWSGFQTEVVPGDLNIYVFSTPTPPCPSPTTTAGQTCPSLELQSREVTVDVRQLLGTGPSAIWSVFSVASRFDGSDIAIPFDPGQDVVSGTEAQLPFRWPLGAEGSAGYAYLSGGCAASVASGPAIQADSVTFDVAELAISDAVCGRTGASASGATGSTSIASSPGQAASAGFNTPTGSTGATAAGGGTTPPPPQPELDQPVDGYVFLVMTGNQVAAFDPLAGPSTYAGTEFAQTPVAFAAAPVHFVPASPDQAPATIPSVANVTCDATNTEVATPVVEPQPDGVHISVQNTSGTNLGIEVKDVGGENATAGTSETVWQFGPRPYQVRCTPNGNEVPGPYQTLDVQDPQHLWVSNQLDCNAVTGVNADYVPGAKGDKTPPIELLQEHVTGLQPNDVLQAAGYSDAPDPQVRVVRDGTVIAVYQFMSDGQGGRLLSSSQQCSDSNLSWQEASSSPYPRGAFTSCPSAPFPPFVGDWRLSASDVAQKFVDLHRSGDAAAVRDLEDPSVPADATWPIPMPPAPSPSLMETSAGGGNLVGFGCGPDVDANTVSVTFDDGTSSASLDFTLYLVYRSDGWKVWGS